jgi:hypothetical protein
MPATRRRDQHPDFRLVPWQSEAAGDEASTLEVEQGVSFAAVPVFDVSQTDPIPGHPQPWQPPERHAASGNESLAWTQ